MTEISEWITTGASVASAIATSFAAAGVLYAHRQLRTSRQIAQLQFEDTLAKEYRDLANRLPTKALLGEDLQDDEFVKAFDELFHYIDLSNEQVCLRQRGRISKEVWASWCEGIKTNLSSPTFLRAWNDIQARSESFQELRRLSRESFETDPVAWSKGPT